MGYIYLLQPAELVGTNRYKIGISSKDNLNRLKSYGNGTRYIFFMECLDFLYIENKLKVAFNKSDCIKLIKGKEYFEGDECNIIKIFMTVMWDTKLKHIIDKDKIKNSNYYQVNTKEDIKFLDLIESKSDKIDNIFLKNINKFKFKE
jgi:hypothetical protein